MLASDIIINSLDSLTACLDAIDKIKHDYRNSKGGLKAWNSGRTTYLTKAAENKIAAIERRIDEKFSGGYDDE